MPNSPDQAAQPSVPVQSTHAIDREIGRRIRLLREVRRLSMAEVAAQIGKSVGFISQMERGLSSAAVKELVQIADVLGVDFLTLVASPTAPEEASPIRRKGTTDPLPLHSSGVTKLPLTPANTGIIRIYLITLEPGASTGADLYSHDGEEAGLVTKGCIHLTIGTDEYALGEGDSFRFASSIPHGFRNPGTAPAAALWVNVKH